MSIVRAPRPESGWYALDKRISEDARLSWAARGLLVFLLGKPDNWRISVEHLRKQTEGARVRTGRDGVYALLGELQVCGYVVATQGRRPDGTLGAMEYQVREVASPLPAEPDTAQPLPAQPHTAEATLTKTETAARTEVTNVARTAARGTRLAPDWEPSAELSAFALSRLGTASRVDDETDAFRDYWKAQPGARGVKLDWDATYRNWIRKARGSSHATTGSNRSGASAADRAAERAGRIFRQAGVG